MSERNNKAYRKQLTVMLHEIENNPSIVPARQRRLSKFGLLSYQEQWQVLATKLNTVKNGVQKTAPKWKQTWRDLVYHTRKKVFKNGVDMKSLTEFEQSVLRVAMAPLDHGIGNCTMTDVDMGSVNKSPVKDEQVDQNNTPDICPKAPTTKENETRTSCEDSLEPKETEEMQTELLENIATNLKQAKNVNRRLDHLEQRLTTVLAQDIGCNEAKLY